MKDVVRLVIPLFPLIAGAVTAQDGRVNNVENEQVYNLQPPVQAQVDRRFQFLHHCFGPFPAKGASERLRELRRDAEGDGGDFRVALLGRVQQFLLDEVCGALQELAGKEGEMVNKEQALPHAQLFLRLKLEEPYREKHGREVYDMDPAHPSFGAFTCFMNPYLLQSGALVRFVEEEEIHFD